MNPFPIGHSARSKSAAMALMAAAVSLPAPAATVYDVSVTKVGNAYHAFAVAHIDAAPDAVHAALLDFSRFIELSPDVMTARMLRRTGPNSAVVYIEARSCVFIFCQTVKQQQEFTELSESRIVAVTLPQGSNVRKGSDSWTISAEGRGTRLEWTSSLEPGFWVPPLIGTSVIRDVLEKQGRHFMKGIERLARSEPASQVSRTH